MIMDDARVQWGWGRAGTIGEAAGRAIVGAAAVGCMSARPGGRAGLEQDRSY